MKKLFTLALILSIGSTSIGIVSALKIRDINQTMSDETSSYSYFDSIRWWYESWIFDGFKDGVNKGKFLPYNSITRAEFLKMLFNAKHDDIAVSYDKKCFSDSEMGTWYNKFLCYSKEKGYIKWYDNGTFKPNDGITIAEAYKILVNAYGFTASNDIMDHVFSDQREATMTTNWPLVDQLRIDGYDVSSSKWFYPYLSAAHNMGIRFDGYFSKNICQSGYQSESTTTYCNLDATMDNSLKRGQMINMIYQFQAIAESKVAADSFISGFKEKDGSKMYATLDTASKTLEWNNSHLSSIVSKLPLKIVSSEFKGAYFYNGLKKPKAYMIDGSDIDIYKDIGGTVYSRNTLRLGYDIFVKLWDGSSNETVKLEFYPVFVLDNGEWKLHEEENRFYQVIISDKSSCKDYTDSDVYGFLWYMLVRSSSDLCNRRDADVQRNSIETIGSYKYGIYSINDYNGGSWVYPMGQSSIGIPKIGDTWNDRFNSRVQ